MATPRNPNRPPTNPSPHPPHLLYHLPPPMPPHPLHHPPLPPPPMFRHHLPQYQNPTRYSPTHIQIRRVSKQNFLHEMHTIRHLINNTPFKFISMDTEYPGVVHASSDINLRHPAGQYSLMKSNVDALHLIQVGLTLSDSAGNLATLNPLNPVILVWEFAISDFDLYTHQHNPKSISMLLARGLDFEFHRSQGVHSHLFARAMLDINLVATSGQNQLHWVTFHGAYDFGYLIKALTRNNLPDTLPSFLALVEHYFGKHVYDVRHMMRFHPRLFGGLEEVAARIGVARVLGVGHQAGSDSLLTQMVFQKIKDEFFADQDSFDQKIPGRIYSLTI